MCFYEADYDWYASVYRQETKAAERLLHCHECHTVIPLGTSYVDIYLQEHEECRVCEWDVADTPCETHDYGEIDEYHRCLGCDQILQAIREVEQAEGCPPHAQQPGLSELSEVFEEHENRVQYARHAVELFPALAGHRFIYPLIT